MRGTVRGRPFLHQGGPQAAKPSTKQLRSQPEPLRRLMRYHNVSLASFATSLPLVSGCHGRERNDHS
eukprot:s3362_g1.t1